jgi:hypothetical protein
MTCHDGTNSLCWGAKSKCNDSVLLLLFFFKLFIMLYNSIKNYKRNSKGK